MEGRFSMSIKEVQRLAVLERVVRGDMTIKSGSELMAVGYRHCRRLVSGYKESGVASLPHKLRGRPSNRQMDPEIRASAVEAYQKFYVGFGPTHATEHMAIRQGISVHPETLRVWLIEVGLWKARKERRRHRKWRKRRDRIGELVQFDGSFHLWFEERGPKCCLMTMVDDATGRTYLLFTQDEGTISAMRVLEGWIELYGIPQALYADRLKVYVTDREPTIEEQLAGQEALTQFGRAFRKLGIRIIAAEPAGADDCKRSFAAGHIVPVGPTNTIADGLLTTIGETTWPILQTHVERVITVPDTAIVAAMRLVWERMKLVIEPSAAVGVAVALSDEFRALEGIRTVGIVLCGGNVDLDALPWI